jgi:hypothetical protein
MSSVIRNYYTSSFSFCILLISFHCQSVLAKISSIVLNTSSDSRHSCLILDFKGNDFRFSPFSVMLFMDLFIQFYYVGGYPCIHSLPRAFILKGC